MVAVWLMAYYAVFYLTWWNVMLLAVALTAGIYFALWLHDRTK